MQNLHSPKGQILMHLFEKVQTIFQPKASDLEEVKAALQECQNIEQLLDFLFSTDFPRDESFLSLFEQRIQELDASHDQSFFTL